MSAKEDCEKLMNEVVPLAEEMLAEHGEFYPYGGYMEADGQIVHVGAKDEDTDHPKSKDLIYLLRHSFVESAQTDRWKATALVWDSIVTLPGAETRSDAIQVCLDHVDGYSVEVFFPYQLAPEGEIIYGSSFAHEGSYEIFGRN